ncbi:Tetratricopeptide-like helical domain superfamily [Sesbania bispinosa]|nr:Tetratricopeptide-like helical domain superfamily [Sesbania bispinosa]
MQASVGVRVPTWFSRRRLLEEKLSDLHRCTNLDLVKQIHAQLLKSHLHHDLYVAPKLISAFSLSRSISYAVNVFNQVPHPNVHLYNSIIRAHAHNDSHPSLALATFFDMQRNGISPDNFTYPFLLKACNSYSSLHLVQMIHAHVEKFGFYGDIFVPNSLIDSYSRCGSAGLDGAVKLFLAMEERDVVTWNSMIGGLVKGGELDGASKLFGEMPDRDMVSWNTMLDGYAKAGKMDKAFELFDRMPERNIISWSTMQNKGYSILVFMAEPEPMLTAQATHIPTNAGRSIFVKGTFCKEKVLRDDSCLQALLHICILVVAGTNPASLFIKLETFT